MPGKEVNDVISAIDTLLTKKKLTKAQFDKIASVRSKPHFDVHVRGDRICVNFDVDKPYYLGVIFYYDSEEVTGSAHVLSIVAEDYNIRTQYNSNPLDIFPRKGSPDNNRRFRSVQSYLRESKEFKVLIRAMKKDMAYTGKRLEEVYQQNRYYEPPPKPKGKFFKIGG